MVLQLSYIANGLFWCVAFILILRGFQDKNILPLAAILLGLAIDAYARLWGTPEMLVTLGLSRNPETLTYIGFVITSTGSIIVLLQFIRQFIKIKARTNDDKKTT